VRDGRGELASFRETRTEETGDLLDKRVGGDEGVIFASELLDQLLVLVEFLQVISGHGVNSVVFSAVNVMLITKDTDAHAWPWDAGQFDRPGETLVTLGIVVLEADLKLDGLEKVSLLLVGAVVQQLLHIRAHSGDCDFRHGEYSLPEELMRFLW